MTLYDILKSIPRSDYERLALKGVISQSTQRHIYIYEQFLNEVQKGAKRMQAYSNVSENCCTCEENVRRIVAKMSEAA